MSDPVARVLDGLSARERGTGPEDLVFSPGFNVPFYDDTARKRFYAALEAAGLGRPRAKDDPIVFHDLRHTFGTLAVQAFALSEVKAMMGRSRRRPAPVSQADDRSRAQSSMHTARRRRPSPGPLNAEAAQRASPISVAPRLGAGGPGGRDHPIWTMRCPARWPKLLPVQPRDPRGAT